MKPQHVSRRTVSKDQPLPRSPIELRLLCAEDDELHPGLVGLVAELRRRGYDPEFLVAGAGCARTPTRVDLLVVCRGPGSSPGCPYVQECVSCIEAAGGGVITVELDADLDVNIARVTRCASLQVAIAARQAAHNAAPVVVRQIGARRAIDDEPVVRSSNEMLPPWLHVVPPVAAGGPIAADSSPAVTLSPSTPVQPPLGGARPSSQRRSAVLGVAAVWGLAAALVGLGQILPDPVDDGGSFGRYLGALVRDAGLAYEVASAEPTIVHESTPWSAVHDGDLVIASGEDGRGTTHEPRVYGIVQELEPEVSHGEPPRRMKDFDAFGVKAEPQLEAAGDAFEPVAETARCRETRRRTTDARNEQRWDDARTLLGETECWPAAEIRASLLHQIEAADAP